MPQSNTRNQHHAEPDKKNDESRAEVGLNEDESKDGKSVLLEEEQHGPEGGGSLTYHLISGGEEEDKTQLSFKISQNFSPGGGAPSSWQKISNEQCSKCLKNLQKVLMDRGFHGIKTHPENCKQSREALITFDDLNGIKTTEFKDAGPKNLVYGDLTLMFTPEEILLIKDNKVLKTWMHSRPDASSFQAWKSPKGHLMVILMHTTYSSFIQGVYFSPSGDVKDYELLDTGVS